MFAHVGDLLAQYRCAEGHNSLYPKQPRLCPTCGSKELVPTGTTSTIEPKEKKRA